VLPQIAAPLVLQAPQHSGIADIDGGAQWVQHALNTLGFTPPLREDGNYGRMTRLAVQHFQQDYNIAVDGFAGPQTISALHLALAKKTGEPA
jgi:lysozyme family protein